MKPRRHAVKDSQKAFGEHRKGNQRAASVAKTEAEKGAGVPSTEAVPDFAPVEIRGEPLSATIIEERRQ